MQFVQDEDSCSPNDPDNQQIFEIEVTDAGGGRYLVIKTERWALDPDDLDGFIDVMKKALEMTEDV